MKNNVKQLIIIGGGTSLKEGIEKGLWSKLQYKLTFGCNYSYKFFESTAQVYVDTTFYNDLIKTNDLKKLALIIGQGRNIKERPSNSLVIPCNAKYTRELKDGCYSGALVGLYALSLGIYLLEEGEIFLLGYDYGSIDNQLDSKNRKHTHFYQEQVDHRGIGKTSWYDSKDRASKDFGVYSREKKIKIYNVSLQSKIELFEKIDYDTFFAKLDANTYDQTALRDWIKNELRGKCS